MIKIKGLTKKYDKTLAINNVSFEIKNGEAVALLGPNGAGKSTLVKCLLGLLDYNGEIFVKNLEIRANSKKVKSLISYVPQEPALYDMKTVEIMRFYSSLRKKDPEDTDRILEIVGLSEHKNKFTSELSGGMKQRLSFALALITNSPVLILDEPTSNLDSVSREDLLELTKKLKNEGKTIIFSSHRLDEVHYISDRIVYLESGKLIKDCRLEEFREELGYRIRLNLYLKSEQVDKTRNLLQEKRYVVSTSGENILNVEIQVREKVDVIKYLLQNGIDPVDFVVDETSLDIH